MFKITDQQKQVKLLWLQNPSHMKVDNLNNIGCETTTADVSEQKTKYLKDKIRPLLLSNEFCGLLYMNVGLILIFQADLGSGYICGP
jgi:hypothetical protein